MKKSGLRWALIGLVAMLLAACGGGQGQGAPQAIERYYTALAAKDQTAAIAAACADWEDQARQEAESFTAVSARLEGVTCQEAGQDGDATLVTCSGKIVADYGNEVLEIDLADRTYRAVEESGEWRMCGYK